MWDRFDICAAYQAFATGWHSGQWSKEYQIFGRLHSLGFSTGHGDGLTKGENENARDLLASMIRRYRNGELHIRAR